MELKKVNVQVLNVYTTEHFLKKRNKIWQNVVSKTGYRVEIVIESDNLEFIFNKEIFFISLYGRKDINTGILANRTNGGEGGTGVVYSEKWRKNKSEIMKADFKSGKRVATKAWINHFGKNSPVSKAIQMLDKITEKVIEEFDCARDAFRKYGFKPSSISEAIGGKRNKTAYGYKWKFKN